MSYFLGAIPSGYIIAKQLRGIDIRQLGSGNPGAANVYRTCGKVPGFLTAFFDILKGFLPVMASTYMIPESPFFNLAVGAMTIIGHNWTMFLGFKGGKGVATSAGVCVCLLPIPTLAATAAFLVGAGLTNHISIGSMSAALVLPVMSFALQSPLPFSALSLAIGATILIRHIPNMKRLWAGRELRFHR
ncbi:MAG: glycerol-3-phosphate 1-O-acyltransferase PlsY [Elusimicrobia bacterium]|nr:glycerol-3-phosphate 1-O-acyltransferase PlsY [Elusimicrobiota bacterium]